MNTLVPTAVLSSYPSTLVRMSSIIMPPPAPIKPQMKPTSPRTPRTGGSAFGAHRTHGFLLVAITGFTMNLMPQKGQR